MDADAVTVIVGALAAGAAAGGERVSKQAVGDAYTALKSGLARLGRRRQVDALEQAAAGSPEELAASAPAQELYQQLATVPDAEVRELTTLADDLEVALGRRDPVVRWQATLENCQVTQIGDHNSISGVTFGPR